MARAAPSGTGTPPTRRAAYRPPQWGGGSPSTTRRPRWARSGATAAPANPPPTTTTSYRVADGIARASAARGQIERAEEVGDFEGRGLGGVRAVDGILFEAHREVGADRARGRLLGIGGAHKLPVRDDRALAFEHRRDDRA